MFTFPTTIADAPYLIRVESYVHVPPCLGSPLTCTSDWDYLGYTEIEYSILDMEGNVLHDLMKPDLSPADDERIRQEIEQYINQQTTGEFNEN